MFRPGSICHTGLGSFHLSLFRRINLSGKFLGLTVHTAGSHLWDSTEIGLKESQMTYLSCTLHGQGQQGLGGFAEVPWLEVKWESRQHDYFRPLLL